MPYLSPHLDLSRCPHCAVAKPLIRHLTDETFQTHTHERQNPRWWKVNTCTTCGGAILSGNDGGEGNYVGELYPASTQVDETIPDPKQQRFSSAFHSQASPTLLGLLPSACEILLQAASIRSNSLGEEHILVALAVGLT